ncbi:hypothetical protein FHU23_004556 [Clostridium saccharobutylicum]|nr:hypothetical protein CLOSC_43290 [Clostridium saccharobutylicum]OAV39562.1 hypothetical protein M945_3007 [Clostridium saccharobutylicum DSM 13864]AQS02493.1 hypothetical protein CSACC_43340 [Clostridium saccharobutylicum]AQS16476.1 hypothetical protein CLOSACC_43340 [Clostridium saccharobutylicum]MBA2907845.1 hypothetical protein [Clostridium saccharobutylicum]
MVHVIASPDLVQARFRIAVVRIFFFISSYTCEEIYNCLNNLREYGNIMP